jgi:hypothetical protein
MEKTQIMIAALSTGLCFATSPLLSAQKLDNHSPQMSDSAIDASFGGTEKNGILDRFSFGSYGEAHFATGDQSDNFDIHRLVLFTGYEFNQGFRFMSEIELEHLYSNDPGTDIEWELEQAYFELDLKDQYSLQTGLFLVPLGITNEIHEPTTFYGVERNRVETEIIPSTWTEFGMLLKKTYDTGLQWDVAVHRGLTVDRSNINLNGPDLRGGRQGYGSYNNNVTAATARVKYTGINGLELGAGAQYQNDISEGVEDNHAVLTSAHFIYTDGGFSLRGLTANWNISGNEAVAGVTVPGARIHNQYGGYLEPSYKWTLDNDMSIGVFTRLLYWQNEDAPSGQMEYQAGFNFWPTENIVVKADWIHEDRANGLTNRDNFNFGLGYSF